MKYLVLVCALFVSGSGHAGLLNFDDAGRLTGVSELEVGDTTFNVEFVDGSCVSAFDGC